MAAVTVEGREARLSEVAFTPLSPIARFQTRPWAMTHSDAKTEAEQRPDPADTAPAEGQSRAIPEADQGKDQGADLAYDAPPAEGARDDE